MVGNNSKIKSEMERLIQYQIHSYSHNIYTKTLELDTVHECGEFSAIIRFNNVVHFSIDIPSFKIETPYLIICVNFEFLSSSKGVVYNIQNFRHSFKDKPAIDISDETVAISLVGDLYMKIVFTGLEIVLSNA